MKNMKTILDQNHTAHPPRCTYVFEDEFQSNTARLLLFGVYAFEFCFIVLTNILLIHGLRKTSKVLSLSKKLFIYLSATDLVTGLLTVPFQMLMIILSADATCEMVAVQAFLNAFTPALAMFTVLSITLTRYLSVTRPNFFQKRVKHPHVTVILLIQALSALAVAVWYVIVTQRSYQKTLGAFLVFVTFFCFGMIGAAVAINACILYYLNKHTHKNMAVRQQKNQEYQKAVTKTLLIISVVLILCYLPTGLTFGIVGYFVFTNDETRRDTYNNYIPWAHAPMVLNAGLNSFIYMWRNKKITAYYKKMFCKIEKDSQLPDVLPSVHNRLRVLVDHQRDVSADFDSVTSVP